MKMTPAEQAKKDMAAHRRMWGNQAARKGPVDRELLLGLARDGVPVEDVAEACECSVVYVKKIIRENGS